MIRSGRHRAVSRRAAPAKLAFTQERAVIDRPITPSAFFLPGITVGPALSRLSLTVARWKQRNGCVRGVHSAFSVNGCFSQGIQIISALARHLLPDPPRWGYGRLLR